MAWLSLPVSSKGIISGLSATGLYELYSEHKEAHDLEYIFEDPDEIEADPDTGEEPETVDAEG